jgi:D-alanyl-D-alanine carboxypeptidase/D-alanyl-D-alanine-endopeptidase (penicillin-binding protein 4)
VLRAAVWGTAAILAALGLGACGGSGPSARTHPAGTRTVLTRGADPVSPLAGAAAATITSAVATGRGRTPALTHLQAVLSRVAGGLGPHVGIAVTDLTDGQVLFARQRNVGEAPASLEKLWTSAATLWLLGPDARLHTQLLGVGRLEANGVWHGNLYLRGDGDPTFGDGGWNQVYEDGKGPTGAELVAELRARGIRRVTGRLFADPFRFDSAEGGPLTDNAPDPGDYGGRMSALVYDHGYTMDGLGPATTTVHLVALTARASGLDLYASRTLTQTPPGARVLATLASPPLTTLLALMDVPSDDLFADLFAKQLGYQLFHRGTLRLGALAIRQAISAHYRLSPVIHDGSGLDKADRSSPAQLMSLLTQMSGSSVGEEVRAALPVVARTGTVENIGVRTPAAGRCQAKTGTLDNVTNLAGYCRARDGHTLAFVFLVDGPSNGQALEAFTPMVGAVARY